MNLKTSVLFYHVVNCINYLDWIPDRFKDVAAFLIFIRPVLGALMY